MTESLFQSIAKEGRGGSLYKRPNFYYDFVELQGSFTQI